MENYVIWQPFGLKGPDIAT